MRVVAFCKYKGDDRDDRFRQRRTDGGKNAAHDPLMQAIFFAQTLDGIDKNNAEKQNKPQARSHHENIKTHISP